MTQVPSSQYLDIELDPHDLQALSSADAVAAFFARLGYSTDTRTPQTPANLGITAEGTLSDYQKNEEYVPFEALWEVLQKNTRRVGRTLDAAFEQRMRSEHEKSLSLLLPTKQKLAATGWLIDQLVYCLYGLTEEEVAIVEGRG
jgi:hypothetical protein